VALDAEGSGCCVRIGQQVKALRMRADRGGFEAGADWYWNFYHRTESERGLDAVEDLLMPGRFRSGLQQGETLLFSASCEDTPPAPADDVLAEIACVTQNLRSALPDDAPDWLGQLAIASDQFIVQRGPAASKGASIIAGYPWFADWSRDALISLPGLTLSLGRNEIAGNILDTLMSFADRGMLPNRFCDHGEMPEYNTVDATLWLFNAVDEYVAAAADMNWARRTLPLLTRIIAAHVEGTRFGIRVDESDGLLRAGEPGVQLTWMDAKVGDWVVTPRIGKPVEINALWLNALDVLLRLAIRLRDPEAQSLSKSLLARARAGFSRFWNESGGCLYDVIDVNGGAGNDASVRPNQIFAVSLPYSALSAQQMCAVVDTCSRELLTSAGLRSLSPKDPAYEPHYGGDQRKRDGAYHQGTVWSWLLGPFAWAHFRAYGDAALSRAFLDPVAMHLREDCVGTVSEIFEGDPPHRAQGCFAQAWGVAETLRVWLRLDREIKKNKDE
jgi:predicted glycogen debranching enzyme